MQGAAILFRRPIVIAALLVCLAGAICASAQSVRAPDFTIIALPDPQMYSEYYPDTFKQQTAWIAAHRDDLNIKFVIGLGDNVNDGDSDAQWKNASEAMKTLDESGIPYAMAIGNHDYLHSKPPTRSAPLFNKYFGKSRYAGKNWYGDSTYPAGTSENFFVTLPIEGEKYLLLYLEYFPRKEAIAWAKTVLDRHPDYKVIVVTHALEGSDAYRNGDCDYNGPAAEGLEKNTLNGEEMWDALISQYPNIFLTLNGHVNGAAHEVDFGKRGNVVSQILADYQDDAEGGGGFIRILKFRPSQHQIVVSTFSPSSQAHKNDEQNSFTVPYDSAGLEAKIAGIRGRIRDKECNSIAKGIVSFGKGAHRERVFTDGDGYFATATSLEPGIYRVLVNAPGYSPMVSSLEVRAGFTTPLRMYLAKADREFNMKASAAAELAPGASVSMPISFARIGGFVAPIRFSVAELPAEVTATFKTAPRSARLTLTARSTLPAGQYTFFVIGTAGSMERLVAVELTVSPRQR